MILALAISITPAQILQDAARLVHRASSLSLTLVKTTEEFPRPQETRFWWRKGGFFRAEGKDSFDVGTSSGGWSWWPSKKQYERRPGLPVSFSLAPQVGLDIFSVGWPPIGEAKAVAWHGYSTLRVELDGRKQTTKEAKIYVFVEPKTHAPIGLSMNLGSVTQVAIFKDLKIDPKIADAMFLWSPPAGWKEIKG